MSTSIEKDKISLKEVQEPSTDIVSIFFGEDDIEKDSSSPPLCSDATIDVKIETKSYKPFASSNEFPESERFYGITNLKMLMDKDEKCVYTDTESIDRVKNCSLVSISEGNQIYDAVKSKLQDKENISQLNWEKQPEKIKK